MRMSIKIVSDAFTNKSGLHIFKNVIVYYGTSTDGDDLAGIKVSPR